MTRATSSFFEMFLHFLFSSLCNFALPFGKKLKTYQHLMLDHSSQHVLVNGHDPCDTHSIFLRKSLHEQSSGKILKGPRKRETALNWSLSGATFRLLFFATFFFASDSLTERYCFFPDGQLYVHRNP